MFLLACGVLLSLLFEFSRAGAQMALPPPESTVSFPARRDFLWDGFNVVVLDPGHGGEDSGAVGPEGLQEKDFALRLAKKAMSTLSERLGVRVFLTRERDIALPVRERTALSNYQNADLLISIHAGASFSRKPWRSVGCFYLEEDASNLPFREQPVADTLSSWQWEEVYRTHSKASAEFARILAQKVSPLFKGRAVGVSRGMVKVLQGAAMPAVLVEVGSLSSPVDEALLAREETIEALSSAISEAVLLFKRHVEGAILPSDVPENPAH